MSSSQKNLSFISWQLLSELDEMKHDQYSWLMQARESLLDNWKTYRTRYRSWRRKVDGLVDDLVKKGDTEGAKWLTQTLLRDRMTLDPAEFEITMPTGNGTEIIHIRGCRDQPPAATAEQPPPVPGPDPVRAQLPLPSPATSLEPQAAASVTKKKKKRDQPHSSVPQSSAGGNTEHPVPAPKHPTKATTESRVTTRAQSIRGKRKKNVRDPSRKKIAKRASTKRTRKGPGRPSNSTEEIDLGIDPECHYLGWTVVRLREEVKARNMKPSRHSKASLIHLLIQNEKDVDNEAADPSQRSLDDEASIPKPMEDGTSGPTDHAIHATGNGVVDAMDDGRAETGYQGEPEEHEGHSKNDELQVVVDAVSGVVSELSGNEEEAPEVPKA